MNTKNKSKKSIGILLAAIMVSSVFVAFAPTAFSDVPAGLESRNLSITNPQQHDCVRGTVNVTLNTTLGGIANWWISIDEKCDCYTEMVPPVQCPTAGCSYLSWDTTENFDDMCVERCIIVYNGTDYASSLFRANSGNFTIDNIDPCIECNTPITDTWYNKSAILSDVDKLNVSACDDCCGLHNVSGDLYPFYKLGNQHVEFYNTTDPTPDVICEDEIKECYGHYYEYELLGTYINTSYCGIASYTMTAYDNATDKDGNNNMQTCTLRFGFDDIVPPQVEDADCTETPGAILVTWDAATDECSGVDYYKIYGTHLNDSASKWSAGNSFYAGRTDGTETTFDFTGRDTDNAEYCNWYTFNISAVDMAGNEGSESSATEAQHLKQGPPAKIELDVPDEMTGCGTKPTTANVRATVKDAWDVKIGDVEVCFNTTDGQVCPTMNKTSNTCPKGVASSFFTPPKVVFESYNVTVCAWTCDNESLVECKNILIVPKQAVNATITAIPDMIMAGEGENNESLIVVELVDKNGYPVGGSGNQDVCVFTDAGTFKSTGTWMVCGKMELGMFFAMLVSGDTPTLATVSADVGALYFPETTVAFAGYGSYDIPLYKGWNLISLPLVPEDDAAGMVLLGIVPELSEAWAYDGCDDEWTSGKFEGPWWVGDLETMEVERGYWLEMNESATLTVTGWTMVPGNVPPPTYNVCEGWNLVGYYALPPDKVMTAKKYFTEVTVSYKVLGFDGAPQGWVTVDKGDNLYSGKGYWMKAENDGEITPQEWV